jgi:hypothetical protein
MILHYWWRGPAINLLCTFVTNTKQLCTFSYGSRHCPCHAYSDKIFHLEFPLGHLIMSEHTPINLPSLLNKNQTNGLTDRILSINIHFVMEFGHFFKSLNALIVFVSLTCENSLSCKWSRIEE